MSNTVGLLKKANEVVIETENAIGKKTAHKMLRNVLDNSIKFYDETKDGDKIVNYLLRKVVEVMSR